MLTAAAIAAGGFVLFRQITLLQGKRRKRSDDGVEDDWTGAVADAVVQGTAKEHYFD